jgi:trk system potassium uptake protein TrkH
MQFAFTEIKRLLHPRAVIPIRLGESTVSREVMARVVGFFVTFVIIFMISVFVMSTMGMDMATSFGAVAATLSNIGPGLGDVGPTDNYAAVPGGGKWFLAFLMLLGRLELFTVLVLLSPNYWRK